jgi:Protein of unknown function (DUF1552)
VRSYRASRRAFLAGIGGAVGLQTILRNVEAAAEGTPPPPRFILVQWPLGTLRYAFKPTGTGDSYVTSRILAPFESAGLRDDTTVFLGFTDGHLRCPGGGGTEAGTVFTTTGCTSPGTRANGGEGDDAVAGGPSIDQVFLRRVPSLSSGVTGVNVSCEARVDSYETSSQCLSYGYATQQVTSHQGGELTENMPLMPELSPFRLYATLFSSFMPGGSTPANQLNALTTFRLRKSVLDGALDELRELKRLAPASESARIDAHADAIRALEARLGTLSGACAVPPAPSADLVAYSGNANAYGTAETDDMAHVLAVMEAHQAVLTAALQCDLTRVATFQLAAGTGAVAFRGLWPDEPERIVRHRYAATRGGMLGPAAWTDPLGLTTEDANNYEFMAGVYTWYSARLANWLKVLKESRDVFGATLLDYTVVPYVTEVSQPNKARSPKPACLFGGSKLGLKHGTYRELTPNRPQVDLYVTCAQALLQSAAPLEALAGERFLEFNPGAAPIEGLWEAVS